MKELEREVDVIDIFCDNQGALKILKDLTSNGNMQRLNLKLKSVKHVVRKFERI